MHVLPILTSWKKLLTCVLTWACEAWNLLHSSLKEKKLHLCSTTFNPLSSTAPSQFPTKKAFLPHPLPLSHAMLQKNSTPF